MPTKVRLVKAMVFPVVMYGCQVGIKIAGRNINNLRYADDATLITESEEPLDEDERGE